MEHLPPRSMPALYPAVSRLFRFLRGSCCLSWLIFFLSEPGTSRVMAAGLGESWEWRNPLPQGATLHALAESNGRLIAVGRAGTVMTTPDGMNWTPRISGTTSFLQTVADSGATVVAAGREGTIVTSLDGGLTWAVQSSGRAEWQMVVHGGGIWVAAGRSGLPNPNSVMTSPDGLTWTARIVPNVTGWSFLESLLWTGTRFVLGGHNYEEGGTGLVTSEDGITWATPSVPMPTGIIRGLAWTGTRVVAVGERYIFVAPDGLDWRAVPHPNPDPTVIFHRVFWTGTQLIALSSGEGRIVVHGSPTGDTWTPLGFPPPQYAIGPAAGAGSELIVATSGGFMIHSPDGGATWNPVPSGVAGNCKALTRFAGRWVAVGTEGSLTSSADGVTWIPASSGTIARLRAIARHDGLWVAGGREEFVPAGLSAPRGFSLFTSTDGVTWTDRSFGTAGTPLYSITHTGLQWVAAAMGAVLTSPDGITWQERRTAGMEQNRAVASNGSRLVMVGGWEGGSGFETASDDGGVSWPGWSSSGSFLRGVVWTGTQFVAVGDSGRIITSSTGGLGTWVQRVSGTSRDLHSVAADDGLLVAVGGESSSPVILTSPDGVTWTSRTAPTTQKLYSVIKAGSLYVASGHDGVVLTSPDAVTWTLRNTGTTHELYAAAWDGQQLLVAGEGGTILASTGGRTPVPFSSIVRQPGPGLTVRLTWPAIPGRIYDIESTPTLTPPWLPAPGSPRTATGAEEFMDFTEPNPAAVPKRFFQVQERP